MMYIYWDAKNTSIVVIYFVSLILFGVFFILNLFLAVISDSFSKEQQKEKNIAYLKEIKEGKVLKLMQNCEQQAFACGDINHMLEESPELKDKEEAKTP